MERLLFSVLCLGIFACSEAISRNELYPFGVDHMDNTLEVGDDLSTTEISLQTPVAFFDDYHRSIFINTNGLLSFESELPSFKSDLILEHPSTWKLIAPFYADIDTRLSGNIYYRETQDRTYLDKVSGEIHKSFPEHQNFQSRTLVIITWDEVGYFNEKYDDTNTFQVLIASDGRDSFVLFLYPEDGINWIKSDGKFGLQAPDVPAQIGFNAGDERRSYTLKLSGKDNVRNLGQQSNSNKDGIWLFHVGNTRGGNIDTPADDPSANGPEREPSTCAEGGSDLCDANAQCQDYPTGFCCECSPGFFGNGRNCLKPDVAQRISGKVHGTINNQQIEDETLHAYIVPKDGRVYAAISKVPAVIGISMQSLYPIGGVLGWLFAQHTTPKAKNGYSLTGGDLNRTAVVKFASGQMVEIKQELVNSAAQGYMRLTTHMNGNIPNIAAGATVTVDDGKEEYKRTGQGVITSSSTQTFMVDQVPYRMTIDQTITFKECAANAMDSLENQRLVISRPFVVYGEAEEIVRYATTNKMAPAMGGDPCKNIDLQCDSNAECVPSGNTHQCRCKIGFYGDGLVGRCQDENECGLRSDNCDVNAECINSVGSFTCVCLPGYTGDGTEGTCQSERKTCADLQCGLNAECVTYDINEPVCECERGYELLPDGYNCQRIAFSCNEVDSCDDNAECVFDDEIGQYVCECTGGFSGDGYSCSDTGEPELNCKHCDRNAQCLYDLDRLIFRCQCDLGFTGDGHTCSPLEECNVLNNCGANARCVYDDRSRGYSCRCERGFRGDGFVCAAEPCDIANNCDRNAECRYDQNTGRSGCECNPGFSGDGYECRQAGCNVVNNCDRNAQCVPDYEVGGYTCKCDDGYDGDGTFCREMDRTCNELQNCDLNAECMYDDTTRRYQCRCLDGYIGDGYSCRLTADCYRDPSICHVDAHCLRRGFDHVCVCKDGFTGDGFDCDASRRGGGNYLLIAQGMNVMELPFNPSPGNRGKPAIYIPGQTAIGVGVDCHAKYFYWTDVSGKTISKAKLDGTDSEVIVSGLGSPEGVAIDWVGRNMYWTDSGLDRIEVSNIDGTNRKTLFDTGLVNPRSIAVDPSRGFIFWTDWNRDAPKIERSNMDGSDRKILVEEGLGLPNGLALNLDHQRVCWSDAETNKIECCDYFGRGKITVKENIGYSFDLAYANNRFYWTDWDRKDIQTTDQNGLTSDSVDPPLGGNGRFYGLTVVNDQCPRGNNACSFNNGGCRFLCLPTPNGGRTCACPDDIDEDECNRIGLLRR